MATKITKKIAGEIADEIAGKIAGKIAGEIAGKIYEEKRWAFCCDSWTPVVGNACPKCKTQYSQVGPYSEISHMRAPQCYATKDRKVCQKGSHSAACEKFRCLICLMVVDTQDYHGLHSETCTAFYRQMLDGNLHLTFEQIRDILELERQTRIKKETLLLELLKNNIYK